MYGMGWGMPTEYCPDMSVWRLSDDKKFRLVRSSDDGKRWLLENIDGKPSLHTSFWVSLEDLRAQYSKEEPWSKQKAYAKQHGYIWKDS